MNMRTYCKTCERNYAMPDSKHCGQCFAAGMVERTRERDDACSQVETMRGTITRLCEEVESLRSIDRERDLMRKQRDEARAAEAHLTIERDKFRIERDEARLVNEELDAEVNRWMAEAGKCKVIAKAAREQRDEAHASERDLEGQIWDKNQQIEMMYHNHHDALVVALIPECLRIAAHRVDVARAAGQNAFIDDESFRQAIVTEARALADAAMKARND